MRGIEKLPLTEALRLLANEVAPGGKSYEFVEGDTLLVRRHRRSRPSGLVQLPGFEPEVVVVDAS